jgi:hypothetical protein
MIEVQLDIEDAAPRLLTMSTGNRVHAIADRADDLYETPAVAVRALLAVENIPAAVWEPACGPGAIVRELRAMNRLVHATDLVDYGCEGAHSGRDFLMERDAPAACIVTNPPFKLAEEFVEHAIWLVPEVHMLLRVAFLEGLRWRKKGFQDHLARVHVFAPRLPMMHRAGWDGPVNSNSGVAFAWFCFRRDWKQQGGQSTVNWINWKEMTQVG